jgi:hypothetical protein
LKFDFHGCSVRGNFGDGKINAFDPETGAFIDTVRDPRGKADHHRRAGQVGNGTSGSLNNAVSFTAGPNNEEDGLFGSLSPN